MKTATWTYTDIKAEDVNDLLISKNDKGELEMTFRKVVHESQRAKHEAKRRYRETVIYGTIMALFVAGIIGVASWVGAKQEESLDRELARLNDRNQQVLELEAEREAARQAEKDEFDNGIVYYSKQGDAVVASKRSDYRLETLSTKTVKGNELVVPDYVDTSFKAYMDYRTITDTTSKQYEMQQNAWTGMDGVRRIGDDICVAMGTYYAKECGARFEITLDTGKTFNVIVSDIKADKDTDETNRYTMHGENPKACVIEFIVDVDELGDTSRDTGDVSYSNFKGEVTKIVKL